MYRILKTLFYYVCEVNFEIELDVKFLTLIVSPFRLFFKNNLLSISITAFSLILECIECSPLHRRGWKTCRLFSHSLREIVMNYYLLKNYFFSHSRSRRLNLFTLPYNNQHLVPMMWTFVINSDGTKKARLVGCSILWQCICIVNQSMCNYRGRIQINNERWWFWRCIPSNTSEP